MRALLAAILLNEAIPWFHFTGIALIGMGMIYATHCAQRGSSKFRVARCLFPSSILSCNFNLLSAIVDYPTLLTKEATPALAARRSTCVMIENQKFRPATVIGPLGEPLTLDSLPPRDTRRWVVRRKAEVVAAVNGGLLTIDEACERYDLTIEEFAAWQRAVDRSGMQGLRVTRLQHYRDIYERQQKY